MLTRKGGFKFLYYEKVFFKLAIYMPKILFIGYEGLIEDVILVGAPVPANPDEWQKFGSVVNGRIVNGYCQ